MKREFLKLPQRPVQSCQLLRSPAPEYKYTLEITVSNRSMEELADEMEFASDKLDMMHLILSDELKSYLIALCENV